MGDAFFAELFDSAFAFIERLGLGLFLLGGLLLSDVGDGGGSAGAEFFLALPTDLGLDFAEIALLACFLGDADGDIEQPGADDEDQPEVVAADEVEDVLNHASSISSKNRACAHNLRTKRAQTYGIIVQ